MITVSMGSAGELSVGDYTSRDLTVTIRDLGGLLAPGGHRISGILGSVFFAGRALAIDYRGAQIHLLGQAATDDDARESFVQLPMRLDNGIPRITGLLNEDVPTDFRIDTGASIFESADVYLNITASTWEGLRARRPALAPESYLSASGVGGDLRLPVARIEAARFGSAVVPRPFVIVQPRVGYFARTDAVGFISNNLLEKYSPIVIDIPGGRLLLGSSMHGDG